MAQGFAGKECGALRHLEAWVTPMSSQTHNEPTTPNIKE